MSAAPPPVPAPSAPQAPVPFLTSASTGSSSGFFVKVLAALLGLFVVTRLGGTRVLRLAEQLLQPPALAFQLKRPG